MKQRFAAKYDCRGRVRRPGRQLPFTLDEFREWLLEIFGQDCERAVQCSYCVRWLDFWTAVFDHEVPVARGGGLGLDNLCVCCAECNRVKGKLTGEEFNLLIGFVEENLPAPARRDVYGRLQSGGAFLRLKFKQPKPFRARVLIEDPFVAMDF